MALINGLLYVMVWAFSYIWGISEIAPGVKNQNLKLHMIVSMMLMISGCFLDFRNFIHLMLFEVFLMLIMMLVFRLTSFIASATAVVIYAAQIISALIAANISIFLLNDIIDFRILYKNQHALTSIVQLLVFIGIIKVFRLMMHMFRNIVKLSPKVQRLIVICDMAVFILFIYYQKYTFVNLASAVSFNLSENLPDINRYMLLSYMTMTTLVLMIVMVINHLLITGNNLERYKYKAEVDPMTGVLSRDAGMSYLREAVTRTPENGPPLTIAYIDVNDLKCVNDKYGHKEGDRLLKYITEIIQGNLREMDIMARLGGDEFMIIFQKCTKEQAIAVWQRIDDEFTHINNSENLAYIVSASAGFTEYNSEIHKNVSIMIHEADSEMYHQKKKTKAKNRRIKYKLNSRA